MADTDPTSFFQWFLSLLGFSSGAGALTKTVLSQSAVQARLKKLEEDRDGHTLKIDAINERTVRLDERTEHISDIEQTHGREPVEVADCSSYTAEGEVCWDNDGNFLSIGDSSGVKVFAPTSAFSGDATVSTSGVVTIQANSVALSTDTTGNYVATIADSGASEVTVSGSGSEGAAVTLALAPTITRDSELRAFTVSASAASGSCTAGDLWLKTSATVTLYACTATDTWSTGVGI